MMRAPAAKFKSFFTDEGLERWAREAATDARIAAQNAGGDIAAQDAAAEEARTRVKEGNLYVAGISSRGGVGMIG